MDNEASTALKMEITTTEIKYQLVPPSNQRANNFERAIQTSKNHFISVLCSVDKYSHLQFWDRLIQQATICLNFLRQSRTLPHLSAYTHIFGEFDYNRTPLYPPGTRIVIHYCPKIEHHGHHVDKNAGTKYHQWNATYAVRHAYPKQDQKKIRYSIVPPKQFNMPKISSTNATIHATQSFIHSEHNSAREIPLVALSN